MEVLDQTPAPAHRDRIFLAQLRAADERSHPEMRGSFRAASPRLQRRRPDNQKPPGECDAGLSAENRQCTPLAEMQLRGLHSCAAPVLNLKTEDTITGVTGTLGFKAERKKLNIYPLV